ncbi:MAG: RNA polymerase sigma factor, partial [Planctomycetota bacterium]
MALSEKWILQTLMKWRSRISAAAWVVVRDAHVAEDIFQTVALKALTKDVSFDSESMLLSWAFVTSRREAIDWFRSQRRKESALQRPLSEDILTSLAGDWQTRGALSGESRLSAMEECLKSTPDEARELLRMRYFEGFSCEEAAEKLGIRLNAVYK